MISCKVDFSRLYDDGTVAKLFCAGVGVFPVFSGLASMMNRMGCAGLTNGPIPTGKYWIVDRPRGGLKSWAKQIEKEWRTGNDYNSWFALYRQDGLVNDITMSITRCARRFVCIHCAQTARAFLMLRDVLSSSRFRRTPRTSFKCSHCNGAGFIKGLWRA